MILNSPLSPDVLNRALPAFHFEALIGAGGMGAVYRARRLDLDRLVAVKIFPETEEQAPEHSERFRLEARAMAKLDHPNIVTLLDFGETREAEDGSHPGLLYLEMEFIEGQDLAHQIKDSPPDPTAAIDLILQVCTGLEYSHLQDIVHRDIKPGNILITSEGTVKIADFGLAKLLDTDTFFTQLTMTRTSMGTRDYASPEQLEEGRDVDGRADVYSTAVVLYQLLTGKLPRGSFPPPSQANPDLSPKLDRIILSALRPNPEERTASISRFASQLIPFQKTGALAKKGWKRRTFFSSLILASGGLAAWHYYPKNENQKKAPSPLASIGPLRAFGRDLGGSTIDLNPAAGINDFTSVAATPLGDWIAIRRDGSSVSNQKELNDLKNIVQVNAGFGGLFAVGEDGRLYVSGILAETSLAGQENVAQVAAGVHVTILYLDGSLRTWNYTAGGWIYPGKPEAYEEVDGPELDDVIKIQGDWYSLIALMKDGSIAFSQLGKMAPRLTDKGRFVDIACGGQHFLALHEDGTVWGWRWPLGGNPDLPSPLPEFAHTSALAVKAEGNFGAIHLPGGNWLTQRVPNAEVPDITKTPGMKKIEAIPQAPELAFFFTKEGQGFAIWIDGSPQ